MSTPDNHADIHKLVESELDKAELIWEQVSRHLDFSKRASLKALLEDSIPTQIPGYPYLEDMKPKVDYFIALVADMRDSSKHLLEAISAKKAKVSQLQRVFYETSALLPALAKTVSDHDGKVTEYLGDGVLALFRAYGEDRETSIRQSYRAASQCLSVTHEVVNNALEKRYSLPPLQIGIGMAMSQAVVTLVGLKEYVQPKVFGECVFRASKLSNGNDEIHVDEFLYQSWPIGKKGMLNFKRTIKNGVNGYLLERSGPS
ncbi:putative adenylate/guanylate cyclase [Desulfonatronospira thiodismutans ASO3-1]|uniref:Adenylate/guanylate cyclase n=1 Tax=Desulfonatronospira thiodismutans ASO3-1 TaxID=555779 RepID=D6SPY7_9BACT|nr:putative adenylate/guanylate cyclase [Desulfonatronospira thiodismutans]EFI34813.1 putative adenylate/guanylate cyclase [Desulfonatronospira thiodismutans ASO3-1]